MFPIAYAAETAARYTVKSLAASLIKVVVNPFVILLAVVAVVIFLWGLLQFMANAHSEEARETGKKHMINGIIGLFIMVSVYGIMRLIVDTGGFKRPNPSDVKLNKPGQPYEFKKSYDLPEAKK